MSLSGDPRILAIGVAFSDDGALYVNGDQLKRAIELQLVELRASTEGRGQRRDALKQTLTTTSGRRVPSGRHARGVDGFAERPAVLKHPIEARASGIDRMHVVAGQGHATRALNNRRCRASAAASDAITMSVQRRRQAGPAPSAALATLRGRTCRTTRGRHRCHEWFVAASLYRRSGTRRIPMGCVERQGCSARVWPKEGYYELADRR
jgi:hypothetical protein